MNSLLQINIVVNGSDGFYTAFATTGSDVTPELATEICSSRSRNHAISYVLAEMAELFSRIPSAPGFKNEP